MTETTKNYVVLNGRKVELFYGDKIKVMGNENAGTYYIEITNASSTKISAAKTIDDNESDNVTETGEDSDNGTDNEEVVDEEDKYRKGVEYLVNMIKENPSEFIKLSAACIGNSYPKFLNPAIAGLNCKDCEKDAVYELASFASETVRNSVIDLVFSTSNDNVKNEILSFLVNASKSINDNNLGYIVKMVEIYISHITTASNAQ